MKKTTKSTKIINMLLIALILVLGALAVQPTPTQANAATTFEATNVTLYTAGGQIMDPEWTEVTEGSKYKSNTTIDAMPVPYMGGEDENVKFVGWYNSVDCTGNAVTSFASSKTYYAKWIRTSLEHANNYMSYTIDGNVDARGKDGLQTTYGNEGYYLMCKLPNGTQAEVWATSTGDIYYDMGNGIFIATVPYTNGHFVSFTYYVQNRSTSTISGMSLGVNADIKIGNQDYAPLTLVQDSSGSYVKMTDGSHALKLFYAGNDAVTNVNTLWTGIFPYQSSNVFYDARGDLTNADSALAFSWRLGSIAPNETVTKSFLLGAGTPSELVYEPTLNYIDNTFPTNSSAQTGFNFTIKNLTGQPGWYFDGWNTSKNGTGTKYTAGQSLKLEKNMRLYAQWKKTLSPVLLTFTLDGSAWKNCDVDLYDTNNVKYDTTFNTTNNRYVANVPNGEYRVVRNGQDTGNKVYVNETGTNLQVGSTITKTYHYYTMKANITCDTLWTDANVTLRNDNGDVLMVLTKTSTSGLTTTYSAISGIKAYTFNLYVNGRDTKIDMATTDSLHSVNALYYTATVNLLENGTGKTNSDVTLSNGKDSYVLTSTNGVYSEKLLVDDTRYSVSVSGVVDDGTNARTDVISSENKTLTINYFTVEAKTYQRGDSDNYLVKSDNFREYHVRSGNKVSKVVSPYVDGLTFSCWSTSPWELGENPDNVTEYDFNTPITAHTVLYAHFLKSEVNINDYVRTTADGTISADGMYLTTPNLTISGFDKGNNAIQSILIQTTDFVQVQFLSLKTQSGVNVDIIQGNNIALDAGNVATNDSVVISFAGKVSMAEAQDYLRKQVVYMPTISTAMTIKIMVSDGIVSASASKAISQSVVSNVWNYVKSTDVTNTQTLFNSTNWYYFEKNNTYSFDGRGTNGSNKSGIKITGTVHFYIPEGVTVYAYGAHGSGKNGGAAGVYLPSGSTLYLFGGGKLVAYGGNASAGSNGANGEDAVRDGSVYTSGAGGKGGDGGGGAGAGIGTDGGKGGAGGKGGTSVSVTWSSKGTAHKSGVAGDPGSDGNDAGAFGTLYCYDVKIEAHGGTESKTGGEGGKCGAERNDSGTGWDYNHVASGGGGGGGGGSGKKANNIGTGGGGGAGGGGGGSGGCDYRKKDKYCHSGGGGGIGGKGVTSGKDGGTGNRSNNDSSSAASGAGGAGGTTQGASSTAKSATYWTYTTKFSVAFLKENGSNFKSFSYYFEEIYIEVPEYTASEGNVFLGWQLAMYGKNVKTSGTQPLTSADKNLLQPGDTIKLSKYTYGNITLKPVTMPMNGKSATDELEIANNVFVSGTQPVTTYYTYTIKLTLDGNPHDFGQIKLVNTASASDVYRLTSSSEAGTYQVVLSDDKTFNVYVADQKLLNVASPVKSKMLMAAPIGSTDLELDSAGEKTVNFTSLNVNVSGVNPQNVTLLGANAPTLEEAESSDGTHTYTAFAQEGVDLSQYQIQIDDFVVPEEEVTACYGNTAKVVFAHADVTVKTNTTISTVELKSTNKSISLVNNEGIWSAVEALDNENVYTLYVNGANTNVTTKLNSANVELVANYYYVEVVTRLNNTASELGTVSINDSPITHMDNTGAWYTYVVSDQQLAVFVNEQETITITPSETLGISNVDYYTVNYTSQNSGGSCPIDTNYYLSGTSATVLSTNDLFSTLAGYYFAGWQLDGKVYLAGSTCEITKPTTLTALWILDNFKVQFVDNGAVVREEKGLALTYKLATTSALATFSDDDYKYTFKGWLCSIDGELYPANTVTDYVVEDLLADDTVPFNENGIKVVKFTAVYQLEYLQGIHFEEYVSPDIDEDIVDEDGNVVLDQYDTDKEIVIDYKVTVNDGINSIVLLPQFNDAMFTLVDVKAQGQTVLGDATITYDFLNSELPVKILFESESGFNATGDVLFTLTYKMINAVGGQHTFGLVTQYREQTTDEIPDNTARSHSYVWNDNNCEKQKEVKIYVDKLVTVYVQMEGIVTVEDQEFVYDSEALTAGIIYHVATEYDAQQTYYEYVDGAFVQATGVSSTNFANKTYFVANDVNDVVFYYNGLGVDNECALHSQYVVRWYKSDANTEIDAPVNVGTYYVGVKATGNNYYSASSEAKAKITITPTYVTITIDDKESIWNEDLAELTGQVTQGVIYEGDDIGIIYATSVTKTSNVGVYANAITATWNNNANYVPTFVAGNYEILLANNSFVVDIVTKDRNYNTKVLTEGTATSIADFYAESKYGNENLVYKFYTFDGNVTYTEISAPKNAGTYYVKAFVAGDANKYAYLESDYAKVVISKALVYMDELTASDKVYNHDTQVWTVEDISGVPANALYTLASVQAIDGEDYVNVGNPIVTVTAVLKDADNYAFADGIDYQDVDCKITKYAIIVTARNQTSQYNGQEVVSVGNNYVISVASGTVPAFVYDDELSITVVRVVSSPAVEGDWTNVGSYALTVNYSTDNYTITVVNGTYTITKAYVEVPTLEHFVYDQMAKVQTNQENALYTFEQTQTNVGTYNVTLKLKDSDNYTWVNVCTTTASFDANQVYYVYNASGEAVKAYLISEFATNQVYYTYGAVSEYDVASTFEEGTTYYTYDEANDRYEQATTVTSTNFDDDTYYVYVTEGYAKVKTDSVEFYDGDTIQLAWVISPAQVTVTIDNKQSVYADDLEELTSQVTNGTVYSGDDLSIELTKAEGTNAGEYEITGIWDNSNYEVTFVDGTYTITAKVVGGNDYQDIVSAIESAIKEYTGTELSWAITDFTTSEILGQVAGDNVYEITATAQINGQDYTNANGKVTEGVWSYYTKENNNVIKKYALTVAIIDGNYTFANGLTADIEVEVFIKQATNAWMTTPSVVAETYSNIVMNSVAKFGDNSTTTNFVAFYSDESCTTLVESANLQAGETYYAKFAVDQTDNYTGLDQVIGFELGFNVNGEIVVYFDGEVSDFAQEIIYNGLTNYFEKDIDSNKYSDNGESDGYTYTITETESAFKDVGTYTLTFTVKDNWLWSDKSDEDIVYTLTINKAPLTITVDDKQIEYLDEMPSYTVTTSDDDFVNGETFATYGVTIDNYVSCNYVVSNVVDTYAMTLADDASGTLATALYNYDLTLVSGELQVVKHKIGVDEEDPSSFDINVQMDDVTATYDAQSHTVTIVDVDGVVVVTYTIDGTDGNSATNVKKNATTQEVESYVVTATLALDGVDSYGNSYADNYELNAQTISANLTINPFEVTVTAQDKTSIYSEDIVEYTSTVSPAFYAVDEMSVTYSTYQDTTAVTLTNESDVGLYVIKALAQGVGQDNYLITYVDGQYEITIATNVWTVELDTVDCVYNGSAIAKGTSESKSAYFSESKFGDDTTEYAFFTCDGATYTAVSTPVSAGTYYVQATVAQTDNYTGLVSDYVKIVISKAVIGVNQDDTLFDVNVKFVDSTVTYDAESHQIVISEVDGVVATYTIDGVDGNSAIDVKRNATTQEVESYVVTATLTLDGTDSYGNSYADNYELTQYSATAQLTINPLAVTLTATDVAVTYGDAPATLSSQATPSFYDRDNVVVSYVVMDGETAITLANDTNVGEYDIVPSATNVSNYTVTYAQGTYTVALAEFNEAGGNDDTTGLKIVVTAQDVYYNRSLVYSYLVKVGTLTLDESAYTVEFFDKDGNEVTPTNAGVYTVQVTVFGTSNYLGEGEDVAKTATFEIHKIALKATTFTYNSDTATWTAVTEDAGADGVSAKALKSGTVLSYTIGGVDYTADMSYTATATGTYTVVVTATNDDNYIPSEATTANVYSVAFAEGSHDRQEANGVIGIADYATQYRFANEKASKPADPQVEGYTFKQWNTVAYDFATPVTADVVLTAIWDINSYTVTWYNQETKIYQETYNYKDMPTYNNTYGTPTKASDDGYTYSYCGWNVLSDTLDTIELPAVVQDAVYYAIFTQDAKSFTIKYYVSTDGSEYVLYKTVTEVVYDTTIEQEQLSQVVWFRTDCWFTDESRLLPAPEKMVSKDLDLYGAYVFDIGNGDVNGDGLVNAPGDITTYRQWIVGGYAMQVVSNGDEWVTVNDTSTYSTETKYFLLRTADVNDDASQDVRDVTTIRMAIVGGYGYYINTGDHVTGQEIDTVQKVALTSIPSAPKQVVASNVARTTENIAASEVTTQNGTLVVDIAVLDKYKQLTNGNSQMA